MDASPPGRHHSLLLRTCSERILTLQILLSTKNFLLYSSQQFISTVTAVISLFISPDLIWFQWISPNFIFLPWKSFLFYLLPIRFICLWKTYTPTFPKLIFHLFSHFPQFPIFQGFPKITKNHIFTKITIFPHDCDFAQNRHFPKNPLFDLFPQNGQNGRSAQNPQNPKNAHFPQNAKNGQNAQNWPFLGIGSKLRFWGDRR